MNDNGLLVLELLSKLKTISYSLNNCCKKVFIMPCKKRKEETVLYFSVSTKKTVSDSTNSLNSWRCVCGQAEISVSVRPHNLTVRWGRGPGTRRLLKYICSTFDVLVGMMNEWICSRFKSCSSLLRSQYCLQSLPI